MINELLIVFIIIVLFVGIGVHEKRLNVMKELSKYHSARNPENIIWKSRGCLIVDTLSNSSFWDGIAIITVSNSGVHFNSLFVGGFLIPWENLNYRKKIIYKATLVTMVKY